MPLRLVSSYLPIRKQSQKVGSSPIVFQKSHDVLHLLDFYLTFEQGLRRVFAVSHLIRSAAIELFQLVISERNFVFRVFYKQ